MKVLSKITALALLCLMGISDACEEITAEEVMKDIEKFAGTLEDEFYLSVSVGIAAAWRDAYGLLGDGDNLRAKSALDDPELSPRSKINSIMQICAEVKARSDPVSAETLPEPSSERFIKLLGKALKLGAEKCFSSECPMCLEDQDLMRKEFKERLKKIWYQTRDKIFQESYEADLASGMSRKDAQERTDHRMDNATAWHTQLFRGQAFFELEQEEELTEAISSLQQNLFELHPRHSLKWPE